MSEKLEQGRQSESSVGPTTELRWLDSENCVSRHACSTSPSSSHFLLAKLHVTINCYTYLPAAVTCTCSQTSLCYISKGTMSCSKWSGKH